MNTISVVIPSHNRADRLMRALHSVYAQTRTPDEVIVVDDGSGDDTAQRIRHEFPQVLYLYQDNRGVSAARNHGIREAGGDWIALLDSDDEWLPAKLDRQLALATRTPTAHLVHCDEIWIRDGRRVNAMNKHRKSGGMIFQRCLSLCAISPSAALLRRDLFDEIGYFDESLPVCEDYDFWLRVCARHPVHYVPQALVRKYGGHADQLSRRYWGMDRFRVFALRKIIDDGCLAAADRDAAIRTLRDKLRIYIAGARKRGKWDEARAWETLQGRYAGVGPRATANRIGRD